MFLKFNHRGEAFDRLSDASSETAKVHHRKRQRAMVPREICGRGLGGHGGGRSRRLPGHVLAAPHGLDCPPPRRLHLAKTSGSDSTGQTPRPSAAETHLASLPSPGPRLSLCSDLQRPPPHPWALPPPHCSSSCILSSVSTRQARASHASQCLRPLSSCSVSHPVRRGLSGLSPTTPTSGRLCCCLLSAQGPDPQSQTYYDCRFTGLAADVQWTEQPDAAGSGCSTSTSLLQSRCHHPPPRDCTWTTKQFIVLKKEGDGAGTVMQWLSLLLRFGGPGFTGLDPGCRHGTTCQAMLRWHPTYKAEENGHRQLLRANLPQQKKGGNGHGPNHTELAFKQNKIQEQEKAPSLGSQLFRKFILLMFECTNGKRINILSFHPEQPQVTPWGYHVRRICFDSVGGEAGRTRWPGPPGG